MARYDDIYAALIKADQTGDKEGAELFAKMIREKDYDNESSLGASALQGLGQGATFGLADEVGAGVRSAIFDPIASMIGGGNIGGVGGEDMSVGESIKDYFTGMGERYDVNLGSQRDALETARREDPWTTGLAELAGGLGTGGAGLTKSAGSVLAREGAEQLTRGQLLRQGMGQAAKTGAGYGAVAGYGYSEGDVIRESIKAMTGDEGWDAAKGALVEAGVGTAVGAGLGWTIGGAIPAVGAGVRKVGEWITRPWTREARLKEVARREVMQSFQDDIDAGEITIEQARKMLRDDPNFTVGDLSSGLRDVTEKVAQTATRGGRVVRDTLKERAEGQYVRIIPRLTEDLGGTPGVNFSMYLRNMQRTAADEGDRLYGIAYRQPTNLSREMRMLLDRTKAGPEGIKIANELATELGKKVPKLQPGSMQSTERVHLILQGMDDSVNRAFKSDSTPNAVARAMRENVNKFKKLVYDENPLLAEANQSWGGHRQAEDALQWGREIFSKKFRLDRAAFNDLSEGAKTHFRIGVIEEVEHKLANKLDGADLTRELLKKRHSREMLELAFGDEKKFREFMDVLTNEAKMQQTFESAVGNSASIRRANQLGSDAGTKLAQLAGYGVSLSAGGWVPPSIGGWLAGKGQQAFRGASGGQTRAYKDLMGNQADLLMGRNLDALTQPTPGLLNTSPALPSAATGLAGGLIASGQPQGLLDQK